MPCCSTLPLCMQEMFITFFFLTLTNLILFWYAYSHDCKNNVKPRESNATKSGQVSLSTYSTTIQNIISLSTYFTTLVLHSCSLSTYSTDLSSALPFTTWFAYLAGVDPGWIHHHAFLPSYNTNIIFILEVIHTKDNDQ